VQIPSDSMNQTLVEGDRIVVNKLAYGPRFPMTPLSFSFISKSLFLDWIQLPYFRLPGYSKVRNNDILIFNFPLDTDVPVDERKKYIKRCIATPGDTLHCTGGNLYINKKALPEKGSIVFSYTIQTTDKENKQQFLTKGTVDSLTQSGIALTRTSLDTGSYTPAVFPNNALIKWNQDNFGPLYIPKKGETIALTKRNIILYQRIIEQYEHNTLQLKNDSVYINAQPTRLYTFKMNYYFVIGDNRYNSNDSR